MSGVWHVFSMCMTGFNRSSCLMLSGPAFMTVSVSFFHAVAAASSKTKLPEWMHTSHKTCSRCHASPSSLQQAFSVCCTAKLHCGSNSLLGQCMALLGCPHSISVSNTAVRASDFCAKLCKASCCKPFYVLTLFGQHVLTTTQQTSIILQQVCNLMQGS